MGDSIGSGTIVNGGIPPSGLTGQEVSQNYWKDGDVFGDWIRHQDTFAHNEALAAYEREREASREAWERESTYNAQEAAKQREYEAYMSNTAFQRKVADYQAAGFSPLAALEGSVGASTPSGSAAHSSGKAASAPSAKNGSNGFGALLGSIIGAIALIATKGISGIAQKTNSAKAASDLQRSKVVDKATEGYFDSDGVITEKGMKRAEELVAREHAKGRKAWKNDDYFDDDAIKRRQRHLNY